MLSENLKGTDHLQDLGVDGGYYSMEHNETGWEGLAWINLAPDRGRRRALVSMAMDIQIPQKAQNFLNSWATINFWRTLLHEGSYEGESNENRKKIFKFNLLNESGTQLYHFST
jgi:hypothetical protein